MKKLNSREFTLLAVNVVTAKFLFTFPHMLVSNGENGSWLCMAISSVAAILLYLLLTKLYLACGRKNILQQAEIMGGKVLKIVVGVISMGLVFVNVLPMVRGIFEAVKMCFLPTIKMNVIIFTVGVTVVLVSGFGIVTLGKLSSLFQPVVLFTMCGFLFFIFPFFRINNIFPVAVEKNFSIWRYGTATFADVFALNFIMPYVDDYKTLKLGGIKALFLSALGIVSLILTYCLLYPFPASSSFILPVYQMARVVKLGTYFQRLEALFEFVWVVSALIYLAFYLCVLCNIFSDIFDTPSQKPYIATVEVLLFSVAFLNPNYTEELISANDRMVFMSPIICIIPLLCSVVYIIYERRKRN